MAGEMVGILSLKKEQNEGRQDLRKLFIFFIVFFCFVQSAWADKVYLKNGNVLEGRVIEEKKDSIILEFNLENGSGNATILNSQIKSIEKTPLTVLKKEKISAPLKQEERLSSPKRQEDLEKKYQRIIIIILLIPACIFLLSFVSLFILNRVFRAEFSRPLGIKLVSFYLNTLNIVFTLFGLMFTSLAANRVILDFKGINLLIFYLFVLGVPLLLFILLAGLFYLRNWARILAIILLALGLVSAVASLTVKKDLAAGFFHDFYQKATQQFSGELQQFSRELKGFPLVPVAEADLFSPNAAFISVLFCLLLILYFFRKETKKAFSDAGQLKKPFSVSWQGLILCLIVGLITLSVGNKLYQEGWKQAFHNQNLFVRPGKSKGILKTDEALLQNLKRYQALEFSFYLPAEMERMSGVKADTVTFLDKKTLRVFNLSRMMEMEFRVSKVSLCARWNPILLSLRILSSPYLGNLLSIKEVKFEQKEGIMQISTKDVDKIYYFLLRNKKGDNLSCMFVTPEKDSFLDEKRIIAMVAAIK